MSLADVKRSVYVSCPFDMLKNMYLRRIVDEGINPEIGLNGTILDDFVLKDFIEVSGVLKDAGLSCTVHAPFTDVSIGAIDKRIRSISIDRLKQAVDIAAVLDAKDMVFHTGWERKIYADMTDRWMDNAIDSLLSIIRHAKASGVYTVMENVFELTPDIHASLFERLGDDAPGFCLDSGHVYAFSKTPLNKWLERLGDRVGHLHLHDNNGNDDEHLAPGQGVIDFDLVFSWLSSKEIRPIFTLEAHDERTVIPGLQAIGKLIGRYY